MIKFHGYYIICIMKVDLDAIKDLLLGVEKPLYVIPVKPGRNMAVILEAAARTHRLKELGFSAAEELNERLKEKNKQQ